MSVIIKEGNTYWGISGTRETRRRVLVIERRYSGRKYVKWTNIRKDGAEGKVTWTELVNFSEWVQGVYKYRT